MNIHDYIEKLRARPVHERQRIAVIATAVGFLVILVIWVLSFNEMNKSIETPTDPASASFNDFKNDFQTGKDSIQNMMQELPAQTGTTGTNNDETSGDSLNTNNIPNNSGIDNLQNSFDSTGKTEEPVPNNQDKTNVPQLP